MLRTGSHFPKWNTHMYVKLWRDCFDWQRLIAPVFILWQHNFEFCCAWFTVLDIDIVQWLIVTKVFYLAAPYWPDGPPPNTNTSEGETVTFDCTTSGKPVPKVTFYKNGVGKCFGLFSRTHCPFFMSEEAHWTRFLGRRVSNEQCICTCRFFNEFTSWRLFIACEMTDIVGFIRRRTESVRLQIHRTPVRS